MRTKEVMLSDRTVIIRKLNGRILLTNNIDLKVFKTEELLQEPSAEKMAIIAKRKTDEEKAREIRSANEIIRLTVIDPIMSVDDVEDLDQPDYDLLFSEIINFMLGEREKIKSFREEEVAPATGQDGAAVPPTAAPTA